MAKLTIAFTLAIAIVVGCANQKAAPEPQTGPPGVDIEYHDRDESAESKSSDADAEPKEKASAKDDEQKDAPKDEAVEKPAPAKKSCNGLKKSQCEVTMGCAWSSDKKCVHQ